MELILKVEIPKYVIEKVDIEHLALELRRMIMSLNELVMTPSDKVRNYDNWSRAIATKIFLMRLIIEVLRKANVIEYQALYESVKDEVEVIIKHLKERGWRR